MLTPRYLLPLDSQTALHRFTDILIIGGGLAGLRAANAVESNQSVLVVTKDRLRESNSSYAQGGIAGVLDPNDCFESHVADTLEAMAAHRPYRPGLGLEAALAEIERGRGTSYDPDVADCCLKYYREEGRALPA